MDFTAANTSLWNPIIQLGLIAGLILIANILRQKISLIRSSLMPISVLAGFLMLILRVVGLLKIDATFLEMITYHAIALGFIALSLRVASAGDRESMKMAGRSGALIVSTYLIQALTGLAISLVLAYTFMPDLFKASGILLPMAYGQGPGQANNIGTSYEALGMAGGRSFGLSLAAAGYLCACLIGVILLNIESRRGKLRRRRDRKLISGSVTIDVFEDQDEIPISESVDRLSVQAALIAVVYLLTFLLIRGLTSGLAAVAPGAARTLSSLLWGFNFIVGSVIAVLTRTLFARLRKFKIMNHQYQNNYLLSRLSGLAFDFMIVAGIASINIEDLTGLWAPFFLMAIAGGVLTAIYLRYMCGRLFPAYEDEAFYSMYGMLTGTISSGILLLREIDPDMETPASSNLVTGSTSGIAFGIPVLLLVTFAASGDTAVFLSILIILAYLAILLFYLLRPRRTARR